MGSHMDVVRLRTEGRNREWLDGSGCFRRWADRVKALLSRARSDVSDAVLRTALVHPADADAARTRLKFGQPSEPGRAAVLYACRCVKCENGGLGLKPFLPRPKLSPRPATARRTVLAAFALRA